jgi:ABC-2 type transport system permease protein
MSFFEVLKFEFKSIFTNIPIVLTIIGGVILYSFFYPQPYSKEVVKTLKVSVIDLDKSELSRKIIYSLKSSPELDIVRQDTNQKDAKQALIDDKIKGIIVIPAHFKRDLALHVSPTIAVGADANYFLIFGSVVEGALKSILTESASIKIGNLLAKNTPLSIAKKEYTPYTLKTINLFNPNMSYTYYIIPAVFILILQQTMLVGLGILGGYFNERKEKYNAAMWMKITSRVLIFGTLFSTHMLFYFGFSFDFYHIPHLASAFDMVKLGLPFILSTIFLGIFFGSLLKNQESATPIVLFTSLPLVFSAGFVWPKEAIPEIVTYFSLLFPCTPAMQGFLKLNQMGANFDEILVQYGLLWLQVILYLLLAIFVLRRNAYKSSPHQ